MGTGGSKTDRNSTKAAGRLHPEGKLKTGSNPENNEAASIQMCFEERKVEYEQQYQKLEKDHHKLQEQFLELKAKYDQDIMNAGDFASCANQINKKLEDALHERDVPIHNEIVSVETQTLKCHGECVNNEQEGGDILVQSQETVYKDQIENLQEELCQISTENHHKKYEIDNLKKELVAVRHKAEEEKAFLKEEFTTKGLLLCERYEEEKKEMNSVWQEKLTKVINNCNQDMTTFRTKLNREKLALEEKLGYAKSQHATLEKKNKLLNNLFEDIRLRYESRESRAEDLERIADLEGQLIMQAEELEKQKDLLKNMKTVSTNGSETVSGTGRRSKKNAKKRKKRSESDAKQESCGSSP